MVSAMMNPTAMGMSGMMPGGMAAPMSNAAPANCLMVPRCTIKMEKCKDGMKMVCSCDDQMACDMVQNLCKMLAGGMCSCCMMMNGMMVCSCNLVMGMCKCEMTKDGVCLTCTSGDAKCCETIQACCECMMACMKAGCTCCVMMNSTPVCCC